MNGVCECGCGSPTNIARQSDARRGYVAGQARRFLPFHRNKMPKPPTPIPEWLLIDDEDRAIVSTRTWIRSHGYAVSPQALYEHSSGKNAPRIKLHNFLMNPPKGFVVDHINGNGFDNRRSNLRVVSAMENAQNQPRLSRANSSGYRGVCFHKQAKKWAAYSRKDKKAIHLGLHETAEMAAKVAYDFRMKYMPGATT
jgi:hypothetical protein